MSTTCTPLGLSWGFSPGFSWGGCAGPGTKEGGNELSPGILPPKAVGVPSAGFKSRGFKISRAPLALRSWGSLCHPLSPRPGGATSGGAGVWHGRSPSPSPQHPLESSSRSGVAPMGPRAMSAHPEPPARGVCDTLAKEGTWVCSTAPGPVLGIQLRCCPESRKPLGLLPFLLLAAFSFSLNFLGLFFLFLFYPFFFFFPNFPPSPVGFFFLFFFPSV